MGVSQQVVLEVNGLAHEIEDVEEESEIGRTSTTNIEPKALG
jgi:hypothetical protein